MSTIYTAENIPDVVRSKFNDILPISEISSVGIDDDVLVVGDGSYDIAMNLIKSGMKPWNVSFINNSRSWEILSAFSKDYVSLRDAASEDFKVYPSGIGFLDKNLGWGWRMSELVIVAGPYSSGKSTISQVMAAHFVNGAGRQFGSGALLCSWEDVAAEVRRNISAFGKTHNCPDLLDAIHVVRRPPDADRKIAWYMDLVEYHHAKYGTKFFLLDPWNEMDHEKLKSQQETEYTRELMKEFRRLVSGTGIILLITTHVSSQYIKGNGEIEAFKIGHSFGSSQFGNKADRGLCVVRSKKFDKVNGHAILRLDKSKVERLMGKKGTIAARFNSNTFDLEYDGFATQEVSDIWKD